MAQRTQEREKADLCSRCSLFDNCIYRSMSGRTTLFCELFDGDLTTGPSHLPRWDPEPDHIQAHTADPGTDQEKPKGLCVDCRHRDTCTLPRPTSGVWRCEKYE